MPKVVVFANNKGGVGKSTLATNLTAARAKANPDEHILFVDLTFTASISSVLGAPPDKGLPMLLERLSLRRRQAQRLNLTALACVVIARLLTPNLGILFAVCLLFTGLVAGLLWRLKRQVNPLTYATTSKWYPNLHVLNGGEALAAFAGTPFPWRIAAEEWTVPAHIDIVAIDLVSAHESFAFVARLLMSVSYAKRVDIDVTRSVKIFLILLSFSFLYLPLQKGVVLCCIHKHVCVCGRAG